MPVMTQKVTMTAKQIAWETEALKQHRGGNPQALRDWYESGAGGAISWGEHGDFEQCVAVAGKYLSDPEGYCTLGSTKVLPASSVMIMDEPVEAAVAADSNQFTTTAFTCSDRRLTSRELRGAYDREYVGDVVVIKITSGYELTVTLNHPVATCRGWIPAAELKMGDHVFCSQGREWNVSPIVVPDVDNVIPTIKDVTESLTFLLAAVPEAVEFHGDGVGSKVYSYLTWPDSDLLFNSDTMITEPISQPDFSGRNIPVRRFGNVVSSLTDGEICISDYFPDAVSSHIKASGERDDTFTGLVSLDDFFAMPCEFCLGSAVVTSFNTVPMQEIFNGTARTIVGFSDEMGRFTGGITPQHIVSIDRHSYRGHVYNLDTMSGWYVANSIIIQNCQLRHMAATGEPAGPHAHKGT
jgi:hypothetical protein